MTLCGTNLDSKLTEPAGSWLEFRRVAHAPIRLFCFPHAGGGAWVFSQWQKYLSGCAEVIAIQPPGRGRRALDAPFESLPALADAAVLALLPLFNEGPFALFGHSMGALLAFEVARRLETSHNLSPESLIVAASRAPFRPVSRITWDLPNVDFLNHLRAMGGTPPEVFANSELLDLFIPLLRSDFKAVETYLTSAGDKVTCPIYAFGGDRDPGAPETSLQEWQQVTTGRFALTMLPGNHFFVSENLNPLLARIRPLLAMSQGVN